MLVEELAGGPVDVVGDVHGEIEPLRALLSRLDYRVDGTHPDRRRLVFVGDLTDRGPDSPAVVRLVSSMVAAGRAQCVLGNHELNLLRGERKQGNRWFFGEDEDGRDGGARGDQTPADEATRAEILDFFCSLPLALEREDLRVVHACWDDAMVQRVRTARDLVAFARAEVERIDGELSAGGLVEEARREAEGWDFGARDVPPPLLESVARLRVERQNRHPVKVLTSGQEKVADEPFLAGGKWRFEQRVPWWERYQGSMVVVGHYWRSRDPSRPHGKGPDLFAGAPAREPLGQGDVMCVDFSIGMRSRERPGGPPYSTALAAYRWPEKRLVFAD